MLDWRYPRNIGSHPSNDDLRHFEFARRYPHPIHVKRGLSPDAVVVALCIVLGAALGLARALGWL